MKKTLSVLLALMLVLALALPAMAEEYDPLGKYDETVTLTTARANNTTVTLDANDPEKQSFEVNRIINAYMEYLNVDVDYLWLAADGDANTTKWTAAMATGDVPDFAMVSDSIYSLLLESDLVADCTDVFNNYASEDYKAMLSDDQIAQMTFDGKIYGIPWPSHSYYGPMLFIRMDWLRKLNLEVPTTFEEVVEVAKAFQEAKLGGEDTIGLLVSGDAGSSSLIGMYNAFDAYYDYWLEGEDGKLVYSTIQPEMREALLAIQKLYADGVINKDFAATKFDQAVEYMNSGKVGIWYEESYYHVYYDPLYSSDPEADVEAFCVVPATGHIGKYQASTNTVGKVFVSSKCEHPEAVMKLINLQLQLDYDAYATYHEDPDGFLWYKLSWNGTFPCSVWSDMFCGWEVEQAWESGVRDSADYDWVDLRSPGIFDAYKQAKLSDDWEWHESIYGKNGAYTKLYYNIIAGMAQMNGHVGLPTETQALMGDVINDKLNTAIQEVIMGADISVFDDACEAWLADGGQDITDEVNEFEGR